MLKKIPFTPLQVIIHAGAWIPILLNIYKFFMGQLSVNPIQDIERSAGRMAVTFLVLTLACTPMFKVFGWRETIKRRRTLGLYTFFFAFIHVTIFVALDFGFSLKLIFYEITQKRYIQVGAIAFILLFLLALTSFKYWMKKLKKNWKRLHRTIYLIAPLAVLHYGWAKKGDLFRLQGDVVRPFIYGLVVIFFLVLRIPIVREKIGALWKRMVQRKT